MSMMITLQALTVIYKFKRLFLEVQQEPELRDFQKSKVHSGIFFL